jgi:hypothetical protein
VPKLLGTVTLVWLLICLAALTLPSSAWINDETMLVVFVLGLGLWLARRKSRRIVEQSKGSEKPRESRV